MFKKLIDAYVKPYLVIIIAVAVSGALTAGVYYIYHKGVIAEQNKQREKDVAAWTAAWKKSNDTALSLEKQLAQFRLDNEQLNERLTDEINRHPVYRQCRLPDGGLRLYNAARSGQSAR